MPEMVSPAARSSGKYTRTWPEFVAFGEQVDALTARVPPRASAEIRALLTEGEHLLREGRQLINWLAGVRVPMPKSTGDFLTALAGFEERCDRIGLRPSGKRRAAGSA